MTANAPQHSSPVLTNRPDTFTWLCAEFFLSPVPGCVFFRPTPATSQCVVPPSFVERSFVLLGRRSREQERARESERERVIAINLGRTGRYKIRESCHHDDFFVRSICNLTKTRYLTCHASQSVERLVSSFVLPYTPSCHHNKKRTPPPSHLELVDLGRGASSR